MCTDFSFDEQARLGHLIEFFYLLSHSRHSTSNCNDINIQIVLHTVVMQLQKICVIIGSKKLWLYIGLRIYCKLHACNIIR